MQGQSLIGKSQHSWHVVEEVQEQVMSITPTSEQVRFFLSDVAVLVQNVGIGILATALLFKVPAATAGTLTFPIWWPLLRAANRNLSVRSSARSGLLSRNTAALCLRALLSTPPLSPPLSLSPPAYTHANARVHTHPDWPFSTARDREWTTEPAVPAS